MTEIYVAGHGDYAKGIVSALSMLLGEAHGVIPVCAYSDEITSIYQLESYFNELAHRTANQGNEVVLFTDIPGGSVNNVALKICASHSHMHLVCGMNLIMIMDFLLNEEKYIPIRITQACQSARDAMCYLNQSEDFITLRQAIMAHNKIIQE